MLISLHANYAINNHVSGIETFCITPSLIVPRTCEGTSQVIAACISEAVAAESNKLAHAVHSNLCTHAKKEHKTLVNRQVKHKVAQVFLCTMPSILVELGFLSHKDEARLLTNLEYQQTLAHGIGLGIEHYFANARE